MNDNPETTTQEPNKVGFVSHYGKLFLAVLTAFSFAFFIFLACENKEFRDSQKNIKQSYVEHIQKADSLYWDMVTYNKDYTSHLSDANATLLTDSLIKLSLGTKYRLSSEQYNCLHEIISAHFAGIGQLHEKYDSKILHDSLLLVTERQVLEGQVKTMLDLHLNKVEHEYSNITLWAAILTILFLVFSFYSIFKMDDLVHQGSEGLRDIRRLKRDGEKIAEKNEELLKENEDIKEKAKSDIKSFIDSQQKIVIETIAAIDKRIDGVKKESEQSFREVATINEKINNLLSDSVGALSEKLSQIEKKYDEELRSKVNELNSYIEQLSNLKSDFENKEKHQEDEERKEDRI